MNDDKDPCMEADQMARTVVPMGTRRQGRPAVREHPPGRDRAEPRSRQYQRSATSREPGQWKEPEREEGEISRWAGENRGILTAVFAVSVALILILAALMVWANTGNDEQSGPTFSITEFNGGSSDVLINATYLGSEAYINIPWNASIQDATMRISGSLPPEKRSYETGRNPIDLDVADIDNDLRPDAVVLNYEDSTMMVMRNLGEGRFQRGRTIETGEAPIRVELAYLNDDEHIDAVVLSEDSRDVRIFINDQVGGFISRGDPFLLPTLPSDLKITDLEGDGDIDVLVSTTNDNNITMYVNDGNGIFSEGPKLLTQGNPTKMAVSDMNGDGLDDIIVSNRRDLDEELIPQDPEEDPVSWFNSVSVFRNQGGFAFIKMVEDLRSQKGVSSITAGDINGDGEKDIVMANLGYHNVTMILSDGSGDFQRGRPHELDVIELRSMDPGQVKLRDLDSDGDLDIWALSRSADSVLFYSNDGRGNFLPYVQIFVGVFPTAFQFLDMDSDGDLDIMTSDWRGWDLAYHGNSTISVIENMRDGIFRTYRQYTTGNSPRGVFARDIDFDGDPDIASANYFGSTVSILENDGLGRFSEDREYPIGLEPYAVVLEDFDGDGLIDGASADEANFRIVLLRSDGKGGFTTERFLYDIGAYPFSLRTGDIDNDGDMDLFTSNYFQNSTTLLFNDGSGNFETMFKETVTVYLEGNMPYDSLMEDLDGDGLKDLITVNRGDTIVPTDTVSIMLNDGSYTFKDITEYQVGKEPTSAVIDDFDKDGDLDIATSNTMDDSFTLLANDGSGSFTTWESHPVADRPQYINSYDFDDDGWLDIVVSASDSNSLTLFRNEKGAGFTKFSDLNIGSYPYAIDMADFNSDGRSDLVLTSVNSNSVIVTGSYYYPKGIKIDVGDDKRIDLELEGLLTEEDSIDMDIKDELRRYIRNNRVQGKDLKVPISVICQQEGLVELSNLLIIYSLD